MIPLASSGASVTVSCTMTRPLGSIDGTGPAQMRILHTSDWHLGATLNHASRDEEHRRFLQWLDATIRAQDVEVLVVAGDVFHYLQPSAEAQELYFDFLAAVRDAPALRQVVVVGGNHDSHARLEAPRSALGALDVRVVGGYTSDSEARLLCPVVGGSGEVELVVVAVPYVHEYRLGVRTTGVAPDAIALSFRRTFAALYERLADRAEQAHPEAALVATGHLATGNVLTDEHGVEIHQFRTIGALGAELFGDRFEYVALGHLHQMSAVERPTVWYSGTPIAMSGGEARSPRHVLVADVEAGRPTVVRPVEVPAFRPIEVLDGELKEVAERLRKLSWTGDLVPYVVATVRSPTPQPNAVKLLADALEGFPECARPRLAHVAVRLVLPEGVDDDGEAGSRQRPRLADLTPEDVFDDLHRRRYGMPPRDDLLVAFRSLLAADPGPGDPT